MEIDHYAMPLTILIDGHGLAALAGAMVTILKYTKIYSVGLLARSDFPPYGSYSVVNGG